MGQPSHQLRGGVLLLEPAQLQVPVPLGQTAAVWGQGVRVPEKTITFCDLLQGKYEEDLKQDCGDFILRRSDGVFAYQLAVENHLLAAFPRKTGGSAPGGWLPRAGR